MSFMIETKRIESCVLVGLIEEQTKNEVKESLVGVW